jgi:predicted ATPase
MEGRRLFHTIRLENILSYGEAGEELTLEPLNVFIGPNASGKSNLIEVLSLLAAAPRDLLVPIREGGGTEEWLWKGSRQTPTAVIDTTISYPGGLMPIRHRIKFTSKAGRFELVDEAIEGEHPTPGHEQPYIYYAYQNGYPVLNVLPTTESGATEERAERRLKREDVSPEQSILSQRRDADLYPELTYVATQFAQIRFYREWNLGRYTAPRLPQKTDLPEDFLLEDAGNLGLVLNNLMNQPETKRLLMERLRVFSEDIEDVTTKIQGGTVQVYLHERGLRHPVPATRLSDGTLRFLCLLVILCHPSPPPLICIEEPELGLHPDILPTVAELLLEAAQRTQLIVTTHSDALVSALSEVPDAVVVTERYPEGTRLRRLERQALEEWLKKYRLGELWQMGEIGGTRW